MIVEQEYETIRLETSKIYSDDTFNCRGQISPVSVADLASSIKEKGLQFPIAVQPAGDVKTQMPPGFDYRIIAGHRRFKACKILGWETVPAMVKTGLSEVDARILNLSENLNRMDLNILQEALALKHLQEAGLPRDIVAKALNKSSGWVQVRFNLLTLPPEIQQEAAAGILNQFQIKSIYSLDTAEEQYAAVRKIKEAKIRGEKPDPVGKKKVKTATIAKERKKHEMVEMSELMAKSIGYGIHTRALAWASGHISSADLFRDIQKMCEAKGKIFIPPLEF